MEEQKIFLNSNRESVKIFQFRGGPDHHPDGPTVQFVSDPQRRKMRLVPGYKSSNNWKSGDGAIIGSKLSRVLRNLSSLEAGEQTSLVLTKYIERPESLLVTPDINHLLSDMRSPRYKSLK